MFSIKGSYFINKIKFSIYFFLKHINMTKTIYISRHGQSEYNLINKIGGDSNITSFGEEYAKSLYLFFKDSGKLNNLDIYTSQLKRTKQTIKHFKNLNITSLEYLNEIKGGDFDNLTYDEIKNNHPIEYSKRKNDKFNYCYPNGESYNILRERVKEIFNEIDNSDKDILIVCHNAVVRIIYSIIYNIKEEDIPHIEIPLHTLFKIQDYNKTNNLTKIELLK